MDAVVVGQRYVSEREPELGLGRVDAADSQGKRITVDFPATKEKRIYAWGTPVLKRVIFRVGETISDRSAVPITIEQIAESDGLLTYIAGPRRVREDEVSDVTNVASPAERFMAGQTDDNEVFDLRWRALEMRARIRQSDVRGFLGGRVELIAHQFYILHEVASRQAPRVLLADEVGLGKTIEACLILQRLLAVGRVKRALVLVPDALVHQWFVELLRRFNLWFSIFDEDRCVALEQSDPAANPFLTAQLGLASVSFLAENATRRAQALAAGWDILVVDEAHHLTWTPEAPSPAYLLVEELAQRTPAMLLLTATPTQRGEAGHFARLRLLDPARYSDFAAFQAQAANFGRVAAIANRLVDGKPLTATDRAVLVQFFQLDGASFGTQLAAVERGTAGARDQLLRTLLDQHGIGRVMFRNTRAAMAGFPGRKYCPASLPNANATLAVRQARELQAEESGEAAAVRYGFREDPRIGWLADLLRAPATGKVLLICRSARKAIALETALHERMKAKSALFHEGLALVQRDRNAAWFAEADGAQLLICSEIGSEGRNFQFAHHLVLFDLPLDPGLVEQRIGRLDRIGQTTTIRIHVPFLAGGAGECVAAWYDRGVGAFSRPLHGGTEYQEAFRARVLELAARFDGSPSAQSDLEALIAETAAFRVELDRKMQEGRDRLLELNSFNAAVAEQVIERVRQAESDPHLRHFLFALLDHFGVRLKEFEGGEVFFDPAHAYVEAFPSLPADGMLATFDRRRALAREDIVFVSADHSLVGDAIDLLLDSPAGTTAFGRLAAREPNLLVEAVFVLEVLADARWQVDQFLAPTPIRCVIDVRGRDLTAERDIPTFASHVTDADLHRFLEDSGFSVAALKTMLEAATAKAAQEAAMLRAAASQQAHSVLSAELQRLTALQRVNDHIRPEELTVLQERATATVAAITQARLRLDAVRVIVESDADA